MSDLFDWAQAMVNAIICIVVLFAFVGCVFRVDGSSMINTLHDKDLLVISDLFFTPQRGDIVMFNKAHTEFLNLGSSGIQPPLVKRVVAVGGDTLDIDYAKGLLTINGVPQSEPFLHERMLPRGDISFPLYVPEGYVFCLGDNRNDSTDSRNSHIGLIDRRYILGRVLFRVLPLTQFGAVT